jgi:hypothetical protein
LFLRIVEGVEAHDDYFKLTRDCCGQLSFGAKQKCTAALRMLALGTAADAVGEMVRMGESTCLKTTVKFARAVVEVFGPEYLREPNAQDTEKLLAIGEARGFPGMLGSIDCMHWQWKNCPKGLRGMYQGHTKEATIILEAVASHDLWIWHAFFGMPGLTTTSTCFNDLRCSGGFAMGNHRRATTPSTAETTTWYTTLPMASILSGLRL